MGCVELHGAARIHGSKIEGEVSGGELDLEEIFLKMYGKDVPNV